MAVLSCLFFSPSFPVYHLLAFSSCQSQNKDGKFMARPGTENYLVAPFPGKKIRLKCDQIDHSQLFHSPSVTRM